MPVISAYSTSGSSYNPPSSYRYKSSLSDRRSYTTSSSSGLGSFYRRSYRYDLPTTSSSYSSSSSYRSSAAATDRTTDTELSNSLSTLATVSPSRTPAPTVESSKVESVRPSRYTSSYGSRSSYGSSRSSDNRLSVRDRDNNCLCAVGGAGSSTSYVSNLRSTALSGVDLYQKYSISSSFSRPSAYERLTAARQAEKPPAVPSSSSILASTTASTALDISKVNSTRDRNSNFDAVPVANNNNTNNNGTTNLTRSSCVTNTPLETNCIGRLTPAANNPGANPASTSPACAPSVRSENSASTSCHSCIPSANTSTTITITTTSSSTITTNTTSVLLSSSSSSSVLSSSSSKFATTLVRKPPTSAISTSRPLHQPGRLRPTVRATPLLLPKSGKESSSLLGLSTYRNQNFLKHECDLVKRELSKSATELAFKKKLPTSSDDSNVPRQLVSSTSANKLPPVPIGLLVGSPKPGPQPKDHEDDDKKHHHYHNLHHHQQQQHHKTNSQLTGIPPSPPTCSAVQTNTPPPNGLVEQLKPTAGPSSSASASPTSILENSTQKNDTFLFKPSSSSTTPTTPTTTTTTPITRDRTESLTTTASHSPSTCCSTARTYPNSRSAAADTMKSLHITTELEESITQATIRLRPSLNGTSGGNGTSNGLVKARFIATASATTDDLVTQQHEPGTVSGPTGDYHHVTATIRIKPKSSISTHSSTNTLNNNNNSSSSNGASCNGIGKKKTNGNNNNDNEREEPSSDSDDEEDDEAEDVTGERSQEAVVDKDPKPSDDEKVYVSNTPVQRPPSTDSVSI